MALEFLSQYFLNPVGLLGLLALPVLLAFYFFRPKPEERVMPSMEFFAEQEESGEVKRALDRIRKNILLILHILMVIGLAMALGKLYLEGQGRPDNAVVVLDRSASMQDEFGDAKNFVKQELGNRNTLILAGEDTEVPLEKASAARVKQYVGNVEARDVKTDIAGTLELARDYPGTVVVASDLDQSVSQRSPAEILKSMDSSGRRIKLMETGGVNTWGIVAVDPGRSNSSVDVKNFDAATKTVSVEVNGNVHSRTIPGGEVETVTFSSSELNRIKLDADGLDADNDAYISLPPDEKFEVMLISDAGNPYLGKAVELIGFTSLETATPPIKQELDADVYIVGETENLLKDTAEEIERQVRNGASLVIFSQQGLQELGFESVPAALGEKVKAPVEIEQPRRINVGSTEVYNLTDIKGETLSSPGAALVKSSYGSGEVLLYNIEDSDFRFDFLYPVFWKEILADLTDRPSIEELNVGTGDRIEQPEVETPGGEKKNGPVTASQSGFYRTPEAVYAANLASADESDTESQDISQLTVSSSGSDKNLQNLIALLLMGAAVGELIYLQHTGDV